MKKCVRRCTGLHCGTITSYDGLLQTPLKNCRSLTSPTLSVHPITCHEDTQSRGIALFIFNLDARWRRLASVTHRPLYPRESAPVRILVEAVWAACAVWTGTKKRRHFAPPEFERRTAFHRLVC